MIFEKDFVNTDVRINISILVGSKAFQGHLASNVGTNYEKAGCSIQQENEHQLLKIQIKQNVPF